MRVSADSGFLDSLRADRAPRLPGAAWLERMRSDALERANELSVPSMREEDWRFTDLRPLTRISFQPVEQPASIPAEALREWLLAEAALRLTFIDGIWSPQLSVLAPITAGAYVGNLGNGLRERPASLEAHLGCAARYENQLFRALNTAFLRDAAVIELAAGAGLPGPVHVLHIATERAGAYAIYPRCLLIAGAGARCTLIEDFVALGAGTYFSAPVTEITLAHNAAVEHVRVQRESAAGFHVATCAVVQSGGSRYRAVSTTTGARISRLEHDVKQAGPGCETELSGLALIGTQQLADTHSFVDHAEPEGRLRQLHKCVVGGAAHAVFNGKILVRPGALQTDAAQSCRALLVSDRAHVDAKPQLEIFADDVKCAHGAAIGQLDPEELFYLRSRGLSDHRARNLLTYAFAAEVIDRVSPHRLAATLADKLLASTEETA